MDTVGEITTRRQTQPALCIMVESDRVEVLFLSSLASCYEQIFPQRFCSGEFANSIRSFLTNAGSGVAKRTAEPGHGWTDACQALLVERVADPVQRIGAAHARAGERTSLRAGLDGEAGEVAAARNLTFPLYRPRALRRRRFGDDEGVALPREVALGDHYPV